MYFHRRERLLFRTYTMSDQNVMCYVRFRDPASFPSGLYLVRYAFNFLTLLLDVFDIFVILGYFNRG